MATTGKQATPDAPMRDQPRNRTALVIIDMINDFDFKDADAAKEQLEPVVERVCVLRDAAERAKVPVIYVNDNFGEWRSDRSRLIERVRDRAEIAPILPRSFDYFVIKPQFSGFYATNLPVLLPKLGVDRLILTGIATEMCVFVTAADAHMRDYGLWVPSDAVISVCPAHGKAALEIMRQSMGAEIGTSVDLDMEQWLSRDNEV